MENEIYSILRLKAVEFPCHKFSTSSSYVVVFLHVIYIPDILAFPFPVYSTLI